MQHFSDELAPIATSLAAHTKQKLSRLALLEHFIAQFSDLYQQFLKTGDLAFIVDDLNRLSQLVGKDIWIIDNQERRSAHAKHINQRGELVVTIDGVEQNLYYGEVSVRLDHGENS